MHNVSSVSSHDSLLLLSFCSTVTKTAPKNTLFFFFFTNLSYSTDVAVAVFSWSFAGY